jgi:hypothetical protein
MRNLLQSIKLALHIRARRHPTDGSHAYWVIYHHI